jgi:hypothetical protein
VWLVPPVSRATYRVSFRVWSAGGRRGVIANQIMEQAYLLCSLLVRCLAASAARIHVSHAVKMNERRAEDQKILSLCWSRQTNHWVCIEPWPLQYEAVKSMRAGEASQIREGKGREGKGREHEPTVGRRALVSPCCGRVAVVTQRSVETRDGGSM